MKKHSINTVYKLLEQTSRVDAAGTGFAMRYKKRLRYLQRDVEATKKKERRIPQTNRKPEERMKTTNIADSSNQRILAQAFKQRL